MYFGVLRLSLHSIYGAWSVLDIGFYNCSIPFASKATQVITSLALPDPLRTGAYRLEL